jgi:O-succinylbenzoate synthase
LPFACGLGTATLLAADVSRNPLTPVDGFLPVRRVDPDPELIHVDEETRIAWLQRMQDAADVSA